MEPLAPLLCSKMFLSMVEFVHFDQENSAIIWATIDTRMEAQMLKRRILRCTELPHLSIYAPTATSTQDGFNTLIDQPPFLNRQYQENRLEGFHLVGSLVSKTAKHMHLCYVTL